MGATRLVLVLLAAMSIPAAAGDLAAAKKDFVRFCGKCHGPGGKGDGPQADALNPKPKDLTNCAAMQSIPDDTLFTAIKEGGEAAHVSKDMPAWKDGMDDAEIHDLVAFIRSLCAK